MKRIVKLFIATSELYQSPLVTMVAQTCDAALTVGEERTLEIPLHGQNHSTQVEIEYNPSMLELTSARLLQMESHSRLRLRARGRELGHTFLTVLSKPRLTSAEVVYRTPRNVLSPIAA
jgi:hypothetical protein